MNSHSFKKRSLFSTLLVLLLYCQVALSQTTLVRGTIRDFSTGEPLPFVNVVFQGTTTGNITDINGFYSISTEENVDSIVVSYVGYNQYVGAVKRGQTQELNIGLKQGIALKEVVIKPGENPAHRIIKKLIENKKANDFNNLNSYSYEVYNKVEFDLNNLDEDFKNKKLLKPVSFIFDNIDSSNTEEKPYLPVFITETISDIHYRSKPKSKKEIIKASKVSGIENASVSQFMGDMYQQVNFYDNNIVFFNKHFASPLSNNALGYYRFYLIDSMEIDGQKCYQLMFKPKRKQELTFNGNVWIADSSYALKQIELSIAEDANINFINSTTMVQKFAYSNGAWMKEKEKVVIDFNPFPVDQKKQTVMGIYGRKTTSYKNFVVNTEVNDSTFEEPENSTIAEDAFEKSADYWNANRHDTLSRQEKLVYDMVDTLQSLPIYRTWVDVVELFVTGYYVRNKLEYGPYYNTYSNNDVEGHRFRFGMRTSTEFSKQIRLMGYIAYGTKDDDIKYKFGFQTFLSKKPRTMIGMYYKNDNEILGQSQNAFTTDNILASVFRRGPLRNLTRAKQFDTYIDRQWLPGFSTKLSFYNRELEPQGNFSYEKLDEATQTVTLKNNITTTELRLLARFAYKEKFVVGVFNRKSLGTKYPIIQSEVTLGVKGIVGSEYNYQKLVLNLKDRIYTNPIGYFDYIIEAGQTWGTLPYPLLQLPGGNETYIYDIYAFNSMNFFEFVNDKYISATISHHFGGFFLNKIPLMRKLKWREVVGAKTIVGNASAKHQAELLLPTYINTLNNKPYYEATAGIENIFKIFRVDAVWRLAYLDAPRAIPFTVKASMQFSF